MFRSCSPVRRVEHDLNIVQDGAQAPKAQHKQHEDAAKLLTELLADLDGVGVASSNRHGVER